MNKRGVTLLEVMAGGAILSLAMFALTQLFSLGMRTYDEVESIASEHEQGSRSQDIVAYQIRNREPWVYGWFAQETIEFKDLFEDGMIVNRPEESMIEDWKELFDIENLPDFNGGVNSFRELTPSWNEYDFSTVEVELLWEGNSWESIIDVNALQKWREVRTGGESFRWFDFGILSSQGLYFSYPGENGRMDEYGAFSLFFDSDESSIMMYNSDQDLRAQLENEEVIEPVVLVTDVEDFQIRYYHQNNGEIFLDENLLLLTPDAPLKVEITTIYKSGRRFKKTVALNNRKL